MVEYTLYDLNPPMNMFIITVLKYRNYFLKRKQNIL